jgi:hypothetical protein
VFTGTMPVFCIVAVQPRRMAAIWRREDAVLRFTS